MALSKEERIDLVLLSGRVNHRHPYHQPIYFKLLKSKGIIFTFNNTRSCAFRTRTLTSVQGARNFGVVSQKYIIPRCVSRLYTLMP